MVNKKGKKTYALALVHFILVASTRGESVMGLERPREAEATRRSKNLGNILGGYVRIIGRKYSVCIY